MPHQAIDLLNGITLFNMLIGAAQAPARVKLNAKGDKREMCDDKREKDRCAQPDDGLFQNPDFHH
jgi:hypothetical protein